MKTTILILLTAVSIVRANLIDLGIADLTQPLPLPFQQFFEYPNGMQNLAGVNVINGQVVWSPFTIFGDDHFDMTLSANGLGADVGWNLTDTGYRGMFVLVESSELIAHLYLIPGGQRFDGTGFIEIDGVIPIGGGVFTGTNFSIPDSGSTLALMGCSIFGLFLLRRKTI